MRLDAKASILVMQADRSRLGRWAQLFLVLGTVSAASTFPVSSAFAQDDDEEEDDDEGEEEEEGEEGDEEDPQPPVTAGGLFTKETYPQAEIERPLTITGGMTELRLGLDMDISADTAFETFGVGLDARHGFADNVEGQFNLRSQLNGFDDDDFGGASDISVKAAVEAGIVYDVVDVRFGLDVPYSKSATVGAKTRVNFELGFPFRYAPKPQVALIALDTFMTFNTDGKPDLTPSVGVIVQPVPMLAVKINAKLIIEDFDTDGVDTSEPPDMIEDQPTFFIPVSLNIQFSPNNKFDMGGEFSFPNLKPFDPDGDGPTEAPAFYDSRFLLLYGQIRI